MRPEPTRSRQTPVIYAPRRRHAGDRLTNLLALAALVVGAMGLWDVTADPGSPARYPESKPYLLTPPPSLVPGRAKVLRILVVGADDRESKGRSDTTMVAFVNPGVGRAALLSIQRDTKVDIPGHGSDKINHAYHFGGVPLLRATVESLLGVKIHHYVKLNFESFAKSVDALGGVYITVDDVEGRGRGMNYDDNAGNLHVHLRPGRRLLDGKQAMGYARYRSDSDLKRAERQRELIKAMVEQHLKGQSKGKTLKALASMLRSVETDIPLTTALKLAGALSNTPQEHIKSALLPCTGGKEHGIYYSRVDEAAALQTLSEIESFVKGDEGTAITLKECGVVVLNGSGTPGAANTAARTLSKADVQVTEIGNAEGFGAGPSELRYHPGAQEAAEEVKRVLGVRRAVLTEDADFNAAGAADIILTLGDDFEPGK